MSNLLSGINARLRGSGRSGGRSPGPSEDNGGPTQAPPTPQHLARSPAPAPAVPVTSGSGSVPQVSLPPEGSPAGELPRPLPAWLNRACAKHIVKGNFMTLSARPKTVEQGEWIAHQVVEHYRNLWNFVRVVHEKDDDGTSICNPTTCPRMSAGRSHSYTWLNSRYEPIELPAYEYITLMQRWISGKIDDVSLFPTDATAVSYSSSPEAVAAGTALEDEWIGKRSGFPKEFVNVCRTIFLQMFRVYAHLYWDHFVEPFYHLNLEKQLNSCFSHFLLTATALDLLKPEDIEPMKPLVDMWAADGTLPPESRAYSYANLKQGKEIFELSEVKAPA